MQMKVHLGEMDRKMCDGKKKGGNHTAAQHIYVLILGRLAVSVIDFCTPGRLVRRDDLWWTVLTFACLEAYLHENKQFLAVQY